MLKKVNPWQILLSTSAGTCTVTAHNTDEATRECQNSLETLQHSFSVTVKQQTKYLENGSGFVQIKYVQRYANLSTC